MAVHRPGDRIPWASRPENQPVHMTRKTYGRLIERLDNLEKEVEALKSHTHGYRAPGPMRPVQGTTTEPSLTYKEESKEK